MNKRKYLPSFLPKKLIISTIFTTLYPLYKIYLFLFTNEKSKNKQYINFYNPKKHVFFGYYDTTPFSKDDKLILATHAPIINRAPSLTDWAYVGYYKLKNPTKFYKIGRSNTSCWQQGCRLRWYGNSNDKVMYNCMVDGKYGTIIQNIYNHKIVKKINTPLYDVSNDGKLGLSVDFARLQRLRPGYGYAMISKIKNSNKYHDNYGIELVDIQNNTHNKLFTSQDLSQIKPHTSMKKAKHYFNVPTFNPSGDKFVFLHLWLKGQRRYSRLFVYDLLRNNYKVINNSGRVSHFNWINDNEIILYSYIKNIKKYIYAIFDTTNNKIRYFGKNFPKQDGHPTLINDSYILTDTYPNKFFMRSLIIYDINKDEKNILTRFNSKNFMSGEKRCDLHPRISNNKKLICVDRILKSKKCITLVQLSSLN